MRNLWLNKFNWAWYKVLLSRFVAARLPKKVITEAIVRASIETYPDKLGTEKTIADVLEAWERP